jgi:hypothetical protein
VAVYGLELLMEPEVLHVLTTLSVSAGEGVTLEQLLPVPVVQEVTTTQLAVPEPTPGKPVAGAVPQAVEVLAHCISTLETVPCKVLV